MNKAFLVVARAIKRDGEIIPAFLAGAIIEGKKVSTELTRRCRDLRKAGYLKTIESFPHSRFAPTKKGLKYFTELLKK